MRTFSFVREGGLLDTLLFLAQALALSLSSYAGKYYYDATVNPASHGWAFPRLLVSLAVVNAVLMLWLVLAVRGMRRETRVLQAMPDGSVRAVNVRVRR